MLRTYFSRLPIVPMMETEAVQLAEARTDE